MEIIFKEFESKLLKDKNRGIDVGRKKHPVNWRYLQGIEFLYIGLLKLAWSFNKRKVVFFGFIVINNSVIVETPKFHESIMEVN